ncbi:MAG: gliding motility-associated C-terminal domain-containing protein, partial [Candidatus Muirbacterium halophilum]|nr:gliding motility-associated C-terminal domain-containing protein [Candidatus Muirbacterium halophilum]
DSLTIYSATPANNIFAEIHPFKGGVETETQYNVVFLQQYNSTQNTGIDKFNIMLPADFTDLRFTSGIDFIKGKDREYVVSQTLPIDNTQAFVSITSPTALKSGTLEVMIGEKYQYNNETFEISFTVKNPLAGGNYTISSKAGNRDVNDTMAVTAANIDGNASNNNSPDPLVVNITSPADEVFAEITPHVIKPAGTSEISVFTKINTGTGSGVDTIIIKTNGINSFDISSLVSSFNIDGSGYTVIESGIPQAYEVLAKVDINNSDIIILTIGGAKITGNNRTVEFKFVIESSNFANYPQGSLWEISADDSQASHKVIAEPADVDLMPSNGNNVFLYTGNSLGDTHPYAELYVTDSSGFVHFDSIVNGIKAGSIRNRFNYTINPVYTQNDIGIDKITINTQTHIINDITSVSVNIGGVEFTPIYAGNPQSGQALVSYLAPTMEIILGDRIYYGNPTDSRIFIIFEADAPTIQDAGVIINSFLDYTWLNDAVNTNAGDAGALNSTKTLTVVTKQSPVNHVLSEISPADVNVSRAREKFTLRFKPEINAVNSGFSRFSIQLPYTYSNLYVNTSNDGFNQSLALECSVNSIKSVLNDPQNEGEARIITSGNTITVFLADNVYNNDGIGTNYNNSLWTLIFYANTPQASDYINNGDFSDDGKDFILTLDNKAKPLPVIAEAGEADGNVNTPGTMTVVCAPGAKSLIAEAKAVSVNGVSFINNDIIKNSVSNKISVCSVPEIDSTTRGINRIKITIPSEFTNPYFSELRIDENVVTPLNIPAQINGLNYIDVKFPLVSDISKINIDFQVDVNNIEASSQTLTVKGYYNDDSYEVTASSGNDTGGNIGTQSLSYNIISVPARGAVSEIADNDIITFKDIEKTFTLYLKPEITPQDSGIDTVKIYTPSNLYKMLSVESVEWNSSILIASSGSPQVGEYSYSMTDTSLTIVSGSQLIENNKLIKISFKVKTPKYTDIPLGNAFSGSITLAGSDKFIAFTPGNAENSQISNSLTVKVTSVVKTVKSEITPSYVVKGQNKVVFDYYIESDIPADAIGFDKIKLPIPQGYVLNNANELHITEISSGNTITFTKVANPPLAGQYFYEINDGFMIFTLNSLNKIDYSSRVRIRFFADVPNMNVIQDIYAILVNSTSSIQDRSVAGNANNDNSDWNTYTLSSASAEVKEANAKALYIENGKWKISLSLLFNTLMDVESIVPKVMVDNVQAITKDYINKDGEGFWTGNIFLNVSDFNGVIDIKTTGAKDTQGNTVNSSILSLPVEYGVSGSLFINPVDSKLFTIIARVSSQLPTNYTVKAEVKETGYAMETVALSTGFNKSLYNGIYRIKSSKNITLNIKIYDNIGNNVNSAPKVDILQNNNSPLYITDNSFIKIQESNVKILKGPGNTVFSPDIPEELERISDIVTFEKSQIVSFKSNENHISTGLYFYDGQKWISDKEYNGQKVFSAGVFADKNPPQITSLPVKTNINEYSIKLSDISGISTVRVYNGQNQFYSEVIDNTVKFIISHYSPIIQLKAVDNRGNILNAPIIMKAPAGASDLRVYPIPASNYVCFDNKTANSYSLKIYDVSGKTVYSDKNITGYYVWDLNDRKGKKVSNGIYYYKLKYSDGTENNGKIAVLN